MAVAQGLVYPDVRRCLVDLTDGIEHLGQQVTATYRLNVNLEPGGMGELLGPFPLLHIHPPRGQEGYYDKVDRVMLELYAEEDADDILESIKASITGSDIDTGHGYLDSIVVVNSPEDVPYQSATLNKAVATIEVTTRPLN